MIGTAVAHYRITDKLGKGGMGEVWRATDTKLNREVALKILPEALASDTQRMARFQREAEVLASLSHANIGQIYGIEKAGATRALVLEIVEGPTLAERIAGRPLAWREAVGMAVQIANALEAAHEKGIVHRDLKPANIKLTRDEQIKVLDFGLAKAVEGDSDASSESSHSPTMSMGATRAGVILGTAAYMSPEQARGKSVDKRTDIFAFGAVVFEMLTGKKTFWGEDASLTLAAVMKEEPDWSLLPSDTPAALQRLLRRCLAKNPRERLRDIGDARFDMEQVLSAEESEQAEPRSSRPATRWLALAIGIGFLAGALAVMAWMGAQPDANERGSLRAELLSPAEILAPQFRPQVAISPDGSRVIFAVEENGERQLLQRKLAEPAAVVIAGTEGGTHPVISPDGEWVAFYASNQLRKVPIDGGAPEVLTDVRNLFGSTWVTDDAIFFTPHPGEGVFRVSASGGVPERISTPDYSNGEVAHHRPSSLLPDGRHLLVSIWYGSNRYDAALLDLETGERRTLLENVAFTRFVATGHLLFSRSDGIYAVRFDPDSGTVSGPEIPVARDAFAAEGTNLAHFDVSDNGTLVYVPGRAPVRELVWVDRTGQATTLPTPKRCYAWPRFSPDGSRIAVALQDGRTGGVWIVDPVAGTLARLTREGGVAESMAWTPDGKSVVYNSDRSGPGQWGVYTQDADGAGDAERVADFFFVADGFAGPTTLIGSAWEGGLEEGNAIQSLDLNGAAEPTEIVPRQAGVEKYNAVPSPDGRWLAYVSDESGRREVYLTPLPGAGEKRLVSRDGGNRVAWVGDEIFFVSASIMMVVEVTGPDAQLSEPRALFSVEPYWRGDNYTLPNWDVSPDGRHFVMMRFVEDPETAPPRHLNLVTSFFDELLEKVPVER